MCNKMDEELCFIIDYGGFVGVIMFMFFLVCGINVMVDDYVDVMEYVINFCGEEWVGYGIDFIQGYG